MTFQANRISVVSVSRLEYEDERFAELALACEDTRVAGDKEITPTRESC